MMHLEERIWKMAGGFTGVPIMRPYHWCNVLHVSLWAAVVLTLNADGEVSGCTSQIRVRRNTLYEISLQQDLTINCTVAFCNKSAPKVSWHKLEGETDHTVSTGSHIKTEWKQLNSSQGVSFLMFQRILRHDSGLYQCRVGNDVGHAINVSVYDLDPESPKDIWVYVYSAAGTVGFLTIVIVLTVSVQWCKGKPKKESESENQHTAIPMVEASSPRGGVQPLQTASLPAPPSRLSAPHRPQPDKSPERLRDQVYSRKEEDRKGKRNAAEEGSGIVYAALNHQLPSGATPRPRKVQECSEYAAIRVL